MNTEKESPVSLLLSKSARLRLYVALRTTLDSKRLEDELKAHLTWMIQMEKQGRVFLSGPIAPHSGMSGFNGLTVLRAESAKEAQDLLRKDPAIACGAVEVDVFEWTVFEGGIPLMLTLSDSAVSIRSW